MIMSRGNRPPAQRIVALAYWLAALSVGLSLLAAKPAHAETFTVNSTQDFSDINPGDGVCDTIDVVLLSPCTLRGAIQEANETAADTINFDIPNVARNVLKTIKPTKELPTIVEPVTINGYTQPGAAPNNSVQGDNATLMIQLDGSGAPDDANGLRIGVPDTVVKGLVINRFGDDSVQLFTSDSTVQGNFIGTDSAGTQPRGNGGSGVYVPGATSNNQIGGTTPQARNVISGNGVNGILLYGSAHKVVGNYIGTTKSGSGDLGNTANGVAIATSDHAVGNDTAAGANTIAINDLDGVVVFVCGTCTVSPIRNSILRNSIFDNGHLGIDLSEAFPGRVTPNDTQDPDNGPNRLQNYPVLASAVTFAGETTIKGKLNSKPNKTFILRFFSNPYGSPAEGKKYFGSKSVSTNANCNTGILTFTPNKTVAVGQVISATAANVGGNTSETSLGKQVS
jgi:trimeric autotransporter adhesin